MAREYAKVAPSFWNGTTGRAIRDLGADAQVVALYLLTCPSSNMIGLYYLPLPTLCHETGRSLQGASKALRSLGEVGFASYDETEEVVWVPEMARYQIGESLSPGDKRGKGVLRELESYRKSRFYGEFAERYWEAFRLPGDKPLRSPFEAPSKPLRSQEQEQEQEQEQDKTPGAGAPDPDPVEAAFACWNIHAHPSFARADKLNDDRRKKIRHALTLVPLEKWPQAIAAVNAWPWAHGEGEGNTWSGPDLDWLVAKNRAGAWNIVRAAEGSLKARAAPRPTYDPRKGQRPIENVNRQPGEIKL